MIIDAHLHVDDIPALGWQLAAADCVRRLDEAGIERGVVMTIVDAPEVNPAALELIADACAAFPGRLEAFARIHPWYGDESLALLERAIGELGFKGLKLHPVTTIAHPAGEDTLRLIRAAAYDDPAFHHMREVYGGLAAQIVTPVVQKRVAGIVSVHQLGEPRHWTASEIDAYRATITRLAELL